MIPAWNEEHRLPKTLARYIPFLERSVDPFEVLVVTDGVEDRTQEVAAAFSHRNVRVVAFPQRLGKGGAIMAGVLASQYATVGYIDADGPISPEDLRAMVEELSGSDCVVASRRVEGSTIRNQEPLVRRIVGRTWSALVRSILFLPVHDTQCGAKVFQRTAVLPALPAVSVRNWAFDVSLLYHLARDGRSIREHPVEWSHDPDSHLVVAKVVPVMFLSLLGLRLMNLRIARRLPAAWLSRFAVRFAAH